MFNVTGCPQKKLVPIITCLIAAQDISSCGASAVQAPVWVTSETIMF